MGYRDYSTAKGRIVDATGHGDFSTITSAIAALGSGTIFINDGTYTENFTLPAGFHLCSFGGAELLGSVTIVGKITLSAAGASVISGIQLRTNGDYFLEVPGSNASQISLEGCYLDASNHTGINHTSSNAASGIRISYCLGVIDTTGIALWNQSSPGSISILQSDIINNGNSTTANTCSAGSFNIIDSVIVTPVNISGTSQFFMTNSTIDCSTINTTPLVMSTSTTPNYCEHSNLQSGTAAGATINTPAVLILALSTVNSLAGSGNAITGTGTLNAGIVTFTGSASNITTSTVNKLTTYGGTIV